jgi:fatty acid desaturase
VSEEPIHSRSRATLAEIRAGVAELGLDRPAPARVLLELAVHTTLLGLGLAGFLAFEAWSLRGAALALAMLGHVGVTTNAHTWAHRSGHRSRRFNDVVAFFSGNFVSGISFLFWHDKHNRRHHASPNVQGLDPDHDFAPLIALTEADLDGRHGLSRLWYRWQWLVVPGLLAFMIPRMKLEGVGFAWSELRRGPRRALAGLDLVVLAASSAAWWGLPLWLGTLADAVVLNAVREATLSYALFAIFAPAHVPREALFLGGRIPEDVVLEQTATTLDYRAGRVASFFLSGLQYQIEHHLVPGLSHDRYARVRPIVEAACRRHGYPYRVRSWGSALRETLAVLRTPKPVHAALHEAR